MSTIVFQNLVSCFEPQLTETCTTTLKLRVAAAPPLASLDICRNPELGSWGFLQNNSHQESPSSMNKDCSYTHPLSKNSKLSPQSLDLCTENLGSESGSDTFSDCSSIFSASPPLSPTSNSTDDDRTFAIDDCKHKKTTSEKSCQKIKNFPPPLTTMSGASSLQVRRRSDGGRLIIDAVEGPFRNSYLHAQRSDGRLKLCFTNATCSGGEEEEEGNDEEECGGAEGEIEEPGNGFESEKEELDGEMNLLEKFHWFSRCKEGGGSHGGKGLCSNWKPATLWVATS